MFWQHGAMESTAESRTASVLIVDDHPLVRRGLRQLFEEEPDFRVCGEAATEAEAFDLVGERQPDLVVTDLVLGGSSGLELAARIRQYHPEVRVLVLSVHDERLYARRALAAGAHGYVTKWESGKEVVRAARVVGEGALFVGGEVRSPGSAKEVLEQAEGWLAALSDREVEVFLLLGQGFTPRSIAEKLSLSVNTVEVYRGRLKDKLGFESAELLQRHAVWWCREHDAHPNES